MCAATLGELPVKKRPSIGTAHFASLVASVVEEVEAAVASVVLRGMLCFSTTAPPSSCICHRSVLPAVGQMSILSSQSLGAFDHVGLKRMDMMHLLNEPSICWHHKPARQAARQRAPQPAASSHLQKHSPSRKLMPRNSVLPWAVVLMTTCVQQ